MLTVAQRLSITAVFCVVGYYAYLNYLVQDDGFISLRYADHWVRGYGPVWYPGSREFGYTNFLYVALVSALMTLGFDALAAAALVGYGAFAGAIIIVFRLTHLITESPLVASVSVLVIFLNYVVSTFAHGLLEASLQILLVLATYYLAFLYIKSRTVLLAVSISLVASLALLTRLDSALLLLPIAIYLLILVRWHVHLVSFVGVPLFIVGTFLIWCASFYGSFLPNTFFVKGNESRIPYGLWYFHSFLGNELYIYPMLILATLFVLFYRRYVNFQELTKYTRSIILLMPALVWLLYVIYIGGDFISFRLLIPFIVFFHLFTVVILAKHGAYRIIAGLTCGSFVVTASHWYIDQQKPQFYSRGQGIDSPSALRNYVSRDETNWQIAGKALGRLFFTGSKSDPVIATSAAGAIPFYSRLQTIDMHGLNDIRVAERGAKFSNRPGHYRIATKEYLESRRVNLVIGHPQFECGGTEQPMRKSIKERYGNKPVLLIPVSNRCRLMALYIRRDTKVEDLIREGVITKRDVEGSY